MNPTDLYPHKHQRFGWIAPVPAVYGRYKVNPGETVTIACVAHDANAAHILLKLIMSYRNASPVLSRRVKKERRDAVELTNGVEICVFASTSRAMHGYSIPSAAMGESRVSGSLARRTIRSRWSASR